MHELLWTHADSPHSCARHAVLYNKPACLHERRGPGRQAGRQAAFCIFHGFEFSPGATGTQRPGRGVPHQLNAVWTQTRTCVLLLTGVRQTLELNSLNYPFVAVSRLLLAGVALLRGCGCRRGSGLHGPGGAASTGNPPVTCKQNITRRLSSASVAPADI